MQALPAQPESLCIVEMGGVEKQDELGEKGSIGFLYLNIGLQVFLLFYIDDSKILLRFFRAEVMSHRCMAFGSHHLDTVFCFIMFFRMVCFYGLYWTQWQATCQIPEPATLVPDLSSSSESGCRDRKQYVTQIYIQSILMEIKPIMHMNSSPTWIPSLVAENLSKTIWMNVLNKFSHPEISLKTWSRYSYHRTIVTTIK